MSDFHEMPAPLVRKVRHSSPTTDNDSDGPTETNVQDDVRVGAELIEPTPDRRTSRGGRFRIR